MVSIPMNDDQAVLRPGPRLLREREDDFQMACEATATGEAIERTTGGGVRYLPDDERDGVRA